MKKLTLSLAALFATVAFATSASAQDKPAAATTPAATTPAKPAKGQPYEIGPVIVTARPTRPSAVVELGKILPEIEIAKIRQPFLNKIEEAILGEPF